MAMMDGNDPNVRAADWWSENAPPTATAAPITPPSLTTTTNSEADLRAQIAKWAAMPGADPSLVNDPDYWVRTITAKGGIDDPSKLKYWQDAAVGPTAFFNNPNREQGGVGALPGAPANFGATPPTYTAPTWQGGPPPTAPTLATYTAPTQAQLEASPGYQSRMAAGQQVVESSAAAKGSILNGGTQKALANYGQDYASNEYNNLVGQTQSGIALNNNATQTSFGNAFSNYQARYGQFTDAANRGATAFNTNVTNKRNADTDYWTRLNDLYSTGASLAGSSYKAP